MSDQASDSGLIARTRRGDMAAYEQLYRRHVDDAAKVARIVTDDAEDAPELVNEAFTRILTRLTEGGGPDDDLGPYLRTIVRRLAVDRHRGRARTPTADPDILEVLPTADDPIDRADTTHLVRAAFETLPERWQQVLWHTEIEGQSAAGLASMLDVAPNAAAALAYRAREGLRQAYMSVNLPREVRAECRSYTQKLPAYTRGTLSAAATEDMSGHLSTCSDCRDRRDELLLLTADLRGLLVPALLLPTAVGAGAVAAGAGAATGGGVLAWLSPTTWAKNPGTAVASAAGVAVVAVAAALAVTSGGDTPVADPSHDAPSGEVAPAPPDDEPADPPSDPPLDPRPDPRPDPPTDNPEPPADEPADIPVADDADPPADEPEAPDEESGPPAEDPEPDPAPEPEAPSIEVDLTTDVEVDAGRSVRLSVQVAGHPEPSLQWQRQAPPDSAEARVTGALTALTRMFQGPDSSSVTTADAAPGWVDVAGETGTEFVIPETTWRHDGASYRAVATNDSGSSMSSVATLDVSYEPMVIADPDLDAPVDAGDPVTLTASVRSNPIPAAGDITWERRSPTGSWQPLEADTSTTGTGRRTVEMMASFAAEIPDHEAQFRAVIDNGTGDPVATAPADAVVHWAPTFVEDPRDRSAALEDTATIEAVVSANPLDADDIRWEQRDPDTGRWAPADGNDGLDGTLDHEAGATSSLTVDASSKSLNGTSYRVVATPEANAPVVSESATLNVTWPTEVLDGPDPVEKDEGATASFTARFSGSPFEPDEARWQYRTPDQTWTTADAPSSINGDPATAEGATSTLTVNADRDSDARQYRFVTGDVESETAELTVHWEPEIEQQPPGSFDVQWQSDETISAIVDADRDTDLVWQRRPDGSSTWNDVPDQPQPVRTDGHHWESTLPVAEKFQNADYQLIATSPADEIAITDPSWVTVAATGTLRIVGAAGSYCVGTDDTQKADQAVLVDCALATKFTRRPGSDRLVDERGHSPDSGNDTDARCLSARAGVWTYPHAGMVDCDDPPHAKLSWTSDIFPSPAQHEPTTEVTAQVRSAHPQWWQPMCLDVEGGEKAIDAGASLIVYGCHGEENQLFSFMR